MVGVRGFEPPAPASRRQYSTRLSYTPSGLADTPILRLSETAIDGEVGQRNHRILVW